MKEAEEIRRRTSYDPVTGEFIWLVRQGRAAPGMPVGGHWVHKTQGRKMATFMGFRGQVARLAWLYMNGVWPLGDVDHKDGNPLNIKWNNIRDVPHLTNCHNQRKAHKDSKSGVLGAYLTKGGRWQAAICVNRKQKHLGFFATSQEAHQAYVDAKRDLHAGCTL